MTSHCDLNKSGSDDDAEDAAGDSSILYELLELCEWQPVEQRPAGAAAPVGPRHWLHWLRAPAEPPPAVAALWAQQPSWQLCLSSDGAVLAVMQPALLEVRTARDNFTSLVASASVPADARPQRRRLCWGGLADTPLLAAADSDGTVRLYDALAALVCTLPTDAGSRGCGVSELALAPARSPRWAALALVAAYSGTVAAHHVSADGAHQMVFTVDLQGQLYPHGLTSATWDAERQLLVVAGASCQLGSQQLQGLGSCEGISCWRLQSEYPHLCSLQSAQEREVRGTGGWLPWRRGGSTWDAVLALAVSPEGHRLVSVHASGALTVWQFPGLRRQCHWPLLAQPGQAAVSPQLLQLPTERRRRRLAALGAAAGRPVAVAWWSEAALVVARRSGAVTVSCARSMENLLGESAEFFGPALRVTSGRPTPDGGHAFLVLQSEQCRPSAAQPSDDSDEEEEEPPAASAPRRLLEAIKGGLRWAVDGERPARRGRPRRTVCRLTCLRSTTPQQLYARKVELGEYAEALLIAETYRLDSDLVFLRQWQSAPVTEESISEFLSRIGRRALVLAQCVGRVPSDRRSAHLLLQHGLSGTDLEAALAAADPDDTAFQLCDPRRCYEDLPAEQLASREKQLRRRLLQRLGPAAQLAPQQLQLLHYRRQLLQYRERLRTYEMMLGGEEAADAQFRPSEYSRFRDRSALEAALRLAHAGEWRRLQVVLRYHGHQLDRHRLPLLASLPETLPPALYAPLLPEADASGRVVAMETERWEEPDWVESLLLDEGSPRHKASVPDRPDYAAETPAPSADQLSAWYCGRAEDVVRRTGLVSHGLQLLQLGRERNVAGLESLHDRLQTLAALVYDAGHLEVTLDSLPALSEQQLVALLMDGVDPAAFAAQARHRLLPYLARRPAADATRLLRQCLLTASESSLAAAEALATEQPPLLTCPAQRTRLSLDAVETCRAADGATFDAADRILEALPREEAVPAEQRRRRELWRVRLLALRLLLRRQLPLSPAELAEVAADPARVRALLQRLSGAELSGAQPDWHRLLDDMLELQQKVFQVVPPQACHETLVRALLTAGLPAHVRLAGTLMETAPSQTSAVTNAYLRQLPYEAAVELTVSAAQHYFDSSASLVDPNMQLAKQCLQLLEEPVPESVRQERGLQDSLELLLELGVSLLPVQVRLAPDKLSLLRSCLDARPGNYRHDQLLLKLSQLLELPDKWRLIQLVAERALAADDPAAAARSCCHLVEGGHGTAWETCQQVAERDDYTNTEDRLQLLSFCLAHCPVGRLESLLRLRQRLLALLLADTLPSAATPAPLPADAHHEVGSDSDTEEFASAPAAEGAEDDDVEEEEVGGVGVRSALLRGTADLTGQLVRATATTTRAVLRAARPSALLSSAGAASRGLLRSTVAQLQAGRSAETAHTQDQQPDNAAVRQLGVSALSAVVLPGCHRSLLEPQCGALVTAVPEPPPQLTAALSALRRRALRAAAEAQWPAPPDTPLVQEVTRRLLPEDAALALAWTLALPDDQLTVCLDGWPKSELALQLAQYSCTLHLEAAQETEDGGQPPLQLIAAWLQKDPQQLPASCDQLHEQLRRLEERLQLARQSAQLLALDAAVDVERFAGEPEYQRDTILGLAMSDEDAHLAAAAALARQYNVAAAELAREQIVFLLTAPELSCEDVRERLQRRQLQPAALQQPAPLAEALQQRVLPFLAGTDHARLQLAHSLLATAVPSDEVAARCTLLQLLAGSTADFHQLLAADAEQLWQLLPPLVTQLTLEPLQELAPRLGSAALSAAAVTAAGLLNQLSEPCTSAAWQAALQSRQLQQLPPAQFVRLSCSLLFGDAALKQPLERRQERARQLRAAAGDQQPQQLWTEVCSRLDGWLEHLEYLEWDQYQELLDEADDDVYRFARLFDQTRGEPAELRALRSRMVTDGCHLAAMRRILSVYPLDEAAPVSRVLQAALSEAVERLRREPAADWRALAAATEQLRRYLDTDGEGLSVDAVVAEFQRLCDDPQVDDTRRLRAARVLFAQFPSSLEHLPALIHAETVAVLPEGVTPQDTSTPAARLALLARLASDAADLATLRQLRQLLHSWPPFPGDVSADPRQNPLCQLSERALAVDAGHGARFVLKTAGEWADSAWLPAVAHSHLVSLLWKLEPAVGLQAALLSSQEAVRTEALLSAAQLAAEGAGWPLQPATLDAVLAAGALPQTVGTALYSACVSRLLDGHGADPAAAARQLRAAGYDAEAGALLLQARAGRAAAPAAAATINAARHAAKTALSKWLQ